MLKLGANVGDIDRIARILIGIVLIALIPLIGWWGLIGLLPLATGMFRFCPAYSIIGMNTLNAFAALFKDKPAAAQAEAKAAEEKTAA